MKRLTFTLLALTSLAALAGDLTYSSRIQDEDSDLVIAHKAAVSQNRLEHGNSYLNLTTSGTTTLAGPLTLDRVIVATGGTASSVVLTEVSGTTSTLIATIATTTPNTFTLGLRVTGTLRAVTTGAAPANLTLSYR